MSATAITVNAAELCMLIDTALERFAHRNLVEGSEVVDLLLDLRLAVDFEARLAAVMLPVAG